MNFCIITSLAVAKRSTSTVLFTPVGNEMVLSLGESQVISLRVANVFAALSPGAKTITRILHMNVSKVE
jgi:hypothetical protein